MTERSELWNAGQGLIATIDILNSGMSAIPFGKEQETLDAAIERLREALGPEAFGPVEAEEPE